MISIVAPVFNEVHLLPELVRRLTAVGRDLGDYELIVVDDGSSDASWDRLREFAQADEHIRLVRLARNFGHQEALTAGLDAARGDAVVSIDGDLQDPPEVIRELVAKWREGYDVVYAVRTHREGETRFKVGTAAMFYRLINRLSDVDIPEQAGDFRLLSRRALDAYRRMPERARFIRGMTTWIGFRQVGVPYRRAARPTGSSKYPLRRMLHFAADAITSFSTLPLRFVTMLGFVAVSFCFAYLLYTLYIRLFTDTAVEGWTSVIVVMLFLGGVQLVSLGILGQYIGRIFEEVKRRPLYIVEEMVPPEGSG